MNKIENTLIIKLKAVADDAQNKNTKRTLKNPL